MRLLVVLAALAVLAPAPASSSTPAPCRPNVDHGVLPTWARSGFSEPRPRAPHVLGRNGEIVAILFANPLLVPQPAGRNNKILWVARRPFPVGANLHIRAQRMIGTLAVGAPVTRTVPGGPGPSIVDVPRRGCWRFSLRWGRRVDSLDLAYQPG
jgi:hypothetical protein